MFGSGVHVLPRGTAWSACCRGFGVKRGQSVGLLGDAIVNISAGRVGCKQ